eukprot:7515391-Pyramimonas_sp.AAC.1
MDRKSSRYHPHFKASGRLTPVFQARTARAVSARGRSRTKAFQPLCARRQTPLAPPGFRRSHGAGLD